MAHTTVTERMKQLIAEELPGLIGFRRDLHAHPELMYEEARTSQQVQRALEELEIEFACNLAGGTGVLAYLPGQDEARAVALRADMDALPITEATGLDYASQNPGVMHACGHDGHTTMLLGAARVLKRLAAELPDDLPRPVKFIFQPAEEGGAGGLRMVEDGVLQDTVLGPAASEAYGIHCWPLLELGKVSTRVGPLLAAADMFTATITGQMAHAAWPHRSIDPITAAAAIVNSLQTIVSRNIDPIESAVVSVTRLNAGTANNVIPNSATLGGTVRTLSEADRALVKQRVTDIITGVAQAHGCTSALEWEGQGYPVTMNHPEATAKFFRHGQQAVGTGRCPEWPAPVMGGEDFSFYCKEVPSCFFVLGQVPDGQANPYPQVHTPEFNFNDDSLALGVEMFCRLALDLDDE
ncbi:MAG: amidohydrolase [Planctomycetes bacterium]|nr:amidohydrolase [Planctomycetota bacterium]